MSNNYLSIFLKQRSFVIFSIHTQTLFLTLPNCLPVARNFGMPPANKPPRPFVIGGAEKLLELPADEVTALFELATFPVTRETSMTSTDEGIIVFLIQISL